MLAVGIFADPTMAAEVFTMADANAHRHRLAGAIYVRLFQGLTNCRIFATPYKSPCHLRAAQQCILSSYACHCGPSAP
jgi:hypothetical protein